MAILEVGHTTVALSLIKKNILKIFLTISTISFIIFSVYYGYLIINNYKNLFYLLLYLGLFAIVIITFISEICLKNSELSSRKEKRIRREKKRVLNIIIKAFKYTAKGITIAIACTELLNNEYLTISNLFTLVSALILIIQLVIEGILFFALKFIDYLTLSFVLDRDDSLIYKLFDKKGAKSNKLAKKEFKLRGESYYTKQELKIIEELSDERKSYKKERNDYLNEQIKSSKQNIKKYKQQNNSKYKQQKLSNRKKKKIDKKFNNIMTKSNNLLVCSDKLDDLLKKAEKLIDKLPIGIESLKYIPIFLSLINNYATKKYNNVSPKFILSVVGIIVYLVSPFDVIPDKLPKIGFLDENYLIGKCLSIYKDELDKFIDWRDNQGN